MSSRTTAVVAFVLAASAVTPAQAQIPVIDTGAT